MYPIPYAFSSHQQPGGCCRLDPNRNPSLFFTRTVQEAAQIIDQTLKQQILCQHRIQDMATAYRQMIKFEQRMDSVPKETSSLAVIEKVYKKISDILSQSNYTSHDLVNLYHLFSFREVTHLQPAQFEAYLITRKGRGSCLDPIGITHLPLYCISLEPSNESLKALDAAEARPSIESKENTLKFNEQVRQRLENLANFRKHSPKNYPLYLDQILEYGCIHLYDHLLEMNKLPNQAARCEHGIKMSASILAQVIIETRDAIIRTVFSAIPKNCSDIVFLIGIPGSGKSTTLAFLAQESLQQVGDRYQVSGQESLTSDSLNTSQTFLPNIRFVQGTAYVDFPGFEDTKGLWIALGVELGFKALVSSFSPKIVVVTSIMDTEGRCLHAHEFGEYIQRLLGKENKRCCALAFTRYLKMGSFGEKERTQQDLRRTLANIENLKAKIHSIRVEIASLEREISALEELAQEEHTQNRAEILEEIELLQEEIEAPGPNSTERKIRIKKARLDELQRTLSEGGQENHEIKEKKEQIERLNQKIGSNEEKMRSLSQKVPELEKKEQDLAKEIKNIEQVLSSEINLSNEKDNIIQLDDLNHPSTLVRCKETIKKLRPVGKPEKKLSDLHEEQAFNLMIRDIGPGKLWPSELSEGDEQSIDVQEWQNDILESSLVNALTLKAQHPEIGQLLHLPEMDSQLAGKIDRKIVSEFTEKLILCIVKFSFDFAEREGSDPIENIISEIKETVFLGKLSREETAILKETVTNIVANIRSNWSSITKTLQSRNHRGAKTWDELLEIYGRKRKEIKDTHLEEWTSWAAQIIPGLSLKIPDWFYIGRAKDSANLLASEVAMTQLKELDAMLASFKEVLNRIQDLEKSIQKKEEIEQVCNSHLPMFSDLEEFKDSIHQKVQEIAKIYGLSEWSERTKHLRKDFHKLMLSDKLSLARLFSRAQGLALLQLNLQKTGFNEKPVLSDKEKETSPALRFLENSNDPVLLYNQMSQIFVALGEGALFQDLTNLLEAKAAMIAKTAWANKVAEEVETGKVAGKVLTGEARAAWMAWGIGAALIAWEAGAAGKPFETCEAWEFSGSRGSNELESKETLDPKVREAANWEHKRLLEIWRTRATLEAWGAEIALKRASYEVKLSSDSSETLSALQEGTKRIIRAFEVIKSACDQQDLLSSLKEAQEVWENWENWKTQAGWIAGTTGIVREGWEVGVAWKKTVVAKRSTIAVTALQDALEVADLKWRPLVQLKVQRDEVKDFESKISKWVSTTMKKLSKLNSSNDYKPHEPSVMNLIGQAASFGVAIGTIAVRSTFESLPPFVASRPYPPLDYDKAQILPADSRSDVRFVFKAVNELSKKIDETNKEIADYLGLNLNIPLHRVLLQAVILDEKIPNSRGSEALVG